jgi:AhpD family alkylhydroperoxidase
MNPSEFKAERERLNALTLENANLEIKRFFNLDATTYKDGVIPAKNKEMLGLVASMVLRCDDCIRYHLDKCHEHGVSTNEIMEVMNIALVVGGSIVIPHLRRAVEFWLALY